MTKSHSAYYSLLIIAAIEIGRGLHDLFLVPFREAGTDAVVRILIGIVVYISARYLKQTGIPTQRSS
ncbi:MAG TPA: hypothetical protein VMW43_10200 [Bacteroidota bacterium]|nr:hypothetical protein [Bacteroidota bacterium]